MACTRKHIMITGTASGIGKATMEAAVAAAFTSLPVIGPSILHAAAGSQTMRR